MPHSTEKSSAPAAPGPPLRGRDISSTSSRFSLRLRPSDLQEKISVADDDEEIRNCFFLPFGSIIGKGKAVGRDLVWRPKELQRARLVYEMRQEEDEDEDTSKVAIHAQTEPFSAAQAAARA